jgi:hypothetical protein
MTIYDLVFVVGVIALVCTLVVAAVQVLRGRQRRAARILIRLGAAVTVYLIIVVAVSLATPRRTLSQSERRCWDEWCLAVERVTRSEAIGPSAIAKAGEFLYVADVRVTSLAKRRPQRELGVVLYLIDASGRRYDPDFDGTRALAALGRTGAPLDSQLPPGGSFIHRVAFRVPRNAVGLGFVKEGSGPQAVIIADDESLFHKRTMTRLDVVDDGR